MLSQGTARPIYRAVLIGLAVLFVWLTIKVDLLIFAGIVLATCLAHAARCLRRVTALPRGVALALVILMIAVFIGGFGWFFAARLANEFGQLSQKLSDAVASIAASINEMPIGHSLMQHMQMKDVLGANPFSGLFGFASNFAEVLIGFAVILFIGVYCAAEPGLYLAGFLKLVPPGRRGRAENILDQTGEALWDWVLGRLFSMVMLGVLTTAGLWGLGVPLPFALGLLAAILTFIPYVGAFISAIPAVLLALAANTTLSFYVVLLYLALHAIEGYLLIPLVQRRAAHLPPALILTGQLILGLLAGFLGLLLATPALAATIVLVRRIYVEDTLGDHG